MNLEFEIVKTFNNNGEMPDILDFPSRKAQLYYTKNGEMYVKKANPIENGEWGNLSFSDEENLVSSDKEIDFFHLDTLYGFGHYGTYKTKNEHKFIVRNHYVEGD